MRERRVPLTKQDEHTLRMAIHRLKQVEKRLPPGELYQSVVGSRLSLEFGLDEVKVKGRSGSSDR